MSLSPSNAGKALLDISGIYRDAHIYLTIFFRRKKSSYFQSGVGALPRNDGTSRLRPKREELVSVGHVLPKDLPRNRVYLVTPSSSQKAESSSAKRHMAERLAAERQNLLPQAAQKIPSLLPDNMCC